MAITRLAIRNRIKQKLNSIKETNAGDTVRGTWGDELNEYITQAERRVAIDLPDCAIDGNLWGTNDYTVIASPDSRIYEYAKPSAMLRLVAARHLPSGAKIWRAAVMLPTATSLYRRIEISNDTTSGRSTTYAALYGKYIAFAPVSISDTLTIDYVRIPDAMASDTATSDIPEQFIELVEDKVVAMALLQAESASWQAWEDKYNRGMAAVYQRFNLDPPRAFLPQTTK